jgi:EAL and modified HD-GYP domain-containing signal transduction protein
MRVYTARQPILNAKRKVIAYELLFRDSKENKFPEHVPPDTATAKLLLNSYLSIGLESITEGKPALVNFPTAMLRDHLIGMVPYKGIIVEILETVEPNDENLMVIRKLFHKGFVLALDDFDYSEQWDRFLPFIKLIKFDIIQTPLNSIGILVHSFKKRNIRLLAEKVETYEEFRLAQAMGFDYFQGYFFCKPEIMVGKDIDSSQHFLLSVYAEVMKEGFSYKKVELYLEQDIGLTYKLLRFVNSSLFEHKQEITSIKQAIVFLGEVQMRKFVCLIITAELNPGKPMALMQTTIIRARMCELIAKVMGLSEVADAAFLTGLFSTIDAILDRPMSVIMDALPVSKEIKHALVDHDGRLSECVDVSIAFMQGDWDKVFAFTDKYHIAPDYLISSCNNAMQWSATYKGLTLK